MFFISGQPLKQSISRFFLITSMMVFAVSTVSAQTRSVPASQAEMQLSFSPIVKQVAPAVVNIFTKKQVRASRHPMSGLFELFQGFPFQFQSPRQRTERSLGSGVIIDASGLIVTNHHVIKGADEIRIVLKDRREFNAEIILSDPETDLAVLQMQAAPSNLPSLSFGNSDALEEGDLVLAIGNPFGIGQTVTSGIVSALARTNVGGSDYGYFIQTDAAINPGNSGGALVNMNGELIGINSSIFSKGGGSLGIGFAIPANMVEAVVANASQSGKRIRPWIGLDSQDVTYEIASATGMSRPYGALVRQIYPNGPAAQGGLKVGDVILSVNGQEITEARAFRFRLATYQAGDALDLVVMRNGSQEYVQITPILPPETPERQLTRIAGQNPLTGAQIANMNPALAEELRRSSASNAPEVVLLQLKFGDIAHRLGFRPGDIIYKINNATVKNVNEVITQLKNRRKNWEVIVKRQGKLVRITARDR